MTKVVFCYDKKADEVLAVFPEFVCRICERVMCYAHIGQHFEGSYPEIIAIEVQCYEESSELFGTGKLLATKQIG